MSVARRPLLTATAAGTLLCALWFVPSANATGERPAPGETERRTTTGAASGVSAQTGEGQLRLADTGGVDTTPYLFGGAAFLAVGVGLVTYAVRHGAHAAL